MFSQRRIIFTGFGDPEFYSEDQGHKGSSFAMFDNNELPVMISLRFSFAAPNLWHPMSLKIDGVVLLHYNVL